MHLHGEWDFARRKVHINKWNRFNQNDIIEQGIFMSMSIRHVWRKNIKNLNNMFKNKDLSYNFVSTEQVIKG